MVDVGGRILRPEHACLTSIADVEAVGMSLFELTSIGVTDITQRYAKRIRGDGQAPKHVPKLLEEALAAGLTVLKGALSHEAEHLARFFSQARCGVQQSLVRSERGVYGAQRSALEFVEIHGGW